MREGASHIPGIIKGIPGLKLPGPGSAQTQGSWARCYKEDGSRLSVPIKASWMCFSEWEREFSSGKLQ